MQELGVQQGQDIKQFSLVLKVEIFAFASKFLQLLWQNPISLKP